MSASRPLDVHRIAEQAGVRILKPALHRSSRDQDRRCFCPDTLRRIGRAHGADHLRLTLRLIVESEGNAAALQSDVIQAVSQVILTGVVEITAGMLDDIDLAEVRAWAHLVKPGCSSTAAIATAIMWLLASPERLVPRLSAREVAEAAEEAERKEIARKGRENARKRRQAYAGASSL